MESIFSQTELKESNSFKDQNNSKIAKEDLISYKEI